MLSRRAPFDDRLQEGERAVKIGDDSQTGQPEGGLLRQGKDSGVGLQPCRDGHTRLWPGAKPCEPAPLVLDGDAEPDADGHQDDGRDDELRLTPEAPKRAQGQPDRAARSGDELHEILIAADRVAQNAERVQSGLDPGPVGTGIGIDLASGGLVEDRLD